MKVRIFVMLSSLATLSVVAVYFFFRDAGKDTLRFEVAKSLLQVGVVAVAGGVISILTFEYQRQRGETQRESDNKRLLEDQARDLERAAGEKQRDLSRQAAEKDRDLQRQAIEKQRDLERKSVEYREDLLMSTLAATMDAYARTKKARRLLRARATLKQEGETMVLAEYYDLYLDWINDAQLEFENLARDIDTSAPAFTSPAFLKDRLNKMDSYLKTLIDEYETMRSSFAGDSPSLPLADLPVLKDFLLKAEGQFLPAVVFTYHDVLKALRLDLMHPRLASEATTPTAPPPNGEP